VAAEVLPFEQLDEIVGQADQVENGFSVAPVQARRVNISMDETVGVHMGDSTRDLPEDEEEAGRGEVSLAELLPQIYVVGRLRPKHYCVKIAHVNGWLADVQNIRMFRQV